MPTGFGAEAGPPHSPGEIQAAAEAFVREKTASLAGAVGVEVQPLDPRTHLPRCSRLEPFLPPGVRLWGRAQVGVRCAAAEKWSVVLPVHVSVRGPALYAARPLSRGRPLTEADLQLRTADLTQLPAGVVGDAAAALGQVPRVSLAAGQPITGDLLQREIVIAPGQAVTVVFEEGGVRVTAAGWAVGAGGIGDALKVRTASGRVIQGVVTAAGEVRVR